MCVCYLMPFLLTDERETVCVWFSLGMGRMCVCVLMGPKDTQVSGPLGSVDGNKCYSIASTAY
jgi:hypothetical protein